MTYVIGALLIVVALQAAAIVALLIRGTRRTRAERALRESEKRFRLMADRAPGKAYKAELWGEDGKLKVRGYLGPFYRTQTWLKGN